MLGSSGEQGGAIYVHSVDISFKDCIFKVYQFFSLAHRVIQQFMEGMCSSHFIRT